MELIKERELIPVPTDSLWLKAEGTINVFLKDGKLHLYVHSGTCHIIDYAFPEDCDIAFKDI